MKDVRTHLAHRAEHAVELTRWALLAMTQQPTNEGETTTIHKTLEVAAGGAACHRSPDGGTHQSRKRSP
jgi:hypothetical protein